MQELRVDEIYIDHMSGKNANRPELQRMMEYVRRGDTVIVESISRFARNTRDLLELVEQLTEKGVEFVSKKVENKQDHILSESSSSREITTFPYVQIMIY